MYSKKHILVPLIWLIVIGLFAGAPFKVLEEDENHILLEFQLPNYTIDNTTRNEKEVSRINADRAFLTGEEGFPILPYYADIVGIPLDGDIQLTLIDYEDK
ncbi:MAG: hypothetical protein P9L91_00375 [Candidatus Zophobacter franzmannii]|nr:hypothetical protein [Candidatus Zophobacter franzmannii]